MHHHIVTSKQFTCPEPCRWWCCYWPFYAHYAIVQRHCFCVNWTKSHGNEYVDVDAACNRLLFCIWHILTILPVHGSNYVIATYNYLLFCCRDE